MHYLILAAETEEAFESRDDPGTGPGYWASWQGYIEALEASGLMRGAGGLAPPWTASTVRTREGEQHVQDGPYAETKEQLGGYFLIEADDLDVALDWAGRCPAAAYGAVEVRPLLPPTP